MKKYGHTKTLFIQGNKYKWSFKYDYCISCKGVSKKHKGKGLCTSCFDKKRKENPKRVFKLAKQNWKHYYKTRILMFLEKTEHKKKKVNFTKEDFKEYQKEWYQKNKEAISLERKAIRMKNNGENILKAYIKGKYRYFPFAGIERPVTFMNNEKEREIYREKERQFKILKNFYE